MRLPPPGTIPGTVSGSTPIEKNNSYSLRLILFGNKMIDTIKVCNVYYSLNIREVSSSFCSS